MRKLVLTPKFKRAYRKFVRRDRRLQQKIDATLKQLAEDAYLTQLGTHKLSGELFGLWACSCGYDCRIVFAFENDSESEDELIVLFDIGSHNEVY